MARARHLDRMAAAMTDTATTTSWTASTLAAVPDAPSQPPTLGYGLLYPGVRHVFSGPQESAKTLAAYAIGLHIIRHTQERILLMDFEMGPRGAKRRWRDLGATDQELEQHIYYVAPEQPANPDRILELVELWPILVIVDAAAGAFDNENLDDNKRQDAEKWRRLYVDPFFDAGIATLVLDHVVKNADNRGKYTIGSERKTGGGEVHIGFDTVKPIRRGSTGLYKLILHKDREGHHQRGHFHDLHITSHPDTHQLELEFRPVDKPEDGQVWMPTHLMEKLSAELEKAEEPMSRNQLELAVAGGNEHKRTALDHLVRLNYVTETEGPRRSRLYHSTRPFTVSEWENQPDPPPRRTSPPLRHGEVNHDFATSPPPTGGEATSTANTANQNGSPRHGEVNDPEVQALLAHYDLLELRDSHPPADLHDNDDIPL